MIQLRHLLLLFIAGLLSVLPGAQAEAREGPFTVILPGPFDPTQSAGRLNEAWITLDGQNPFRVAFFRMLTADGEPVDAFAITDRQGRLATMPRSVQERLAWGLLMAQSSGMLLLHPAESRASLLDALEVLQDSYHDQLYQHHRVRYWTEVQERAIQLGVYGVAGYFGGIGAITGAAPSVLHNEITHQLSNAPRRFGMLFVSAMLEAETHTLRDHIRWYRTMTGRQPGSSPDDPLVFDDLQRAYQRTFRISVYMEPPASYLLALQDEPGLFAQLRRLLSVGSGAALALAPGSSARVVGDLVATGSLLEAMEQTVDGFIDFSQALRDASERMSRSAAGTGAELPTDAFRWVMLDADTRVIADATAIGLAGPDAADTLAAPEREREPEPDQRTEPVPPPARGVQPQPGAAPSAQAAFRVSSERFAVGQDFDALAARQFGAEYALASWEEVSARYEREGGGFLRAAGMVMRGQEGISSAAVSRNGRHARQGGQRHYFIAWGEVPPSFLVHARAMHGGVPLNLGSWHSDQYLLAMRQGGPGRTGETVLFDCRTDGGKRVLVTHDDGILQYRFIDLASGRTELVLSAAAGQVERYMAARGGTVVFTNAPNYEYHVGGAYPGVSGLGGAGVSVYRGGAHLRSIACTGETRMDPLIAFAARGPESLRGAGAAADAGHQAATLLVSAEVLNMRAGPGTDHGITGQLLLGDPVTVYARRDGWARIGDATWVAERFLSDFAGARVISGQGWTEIEGHRTALTFRAVIADRQMQSAVLRIAVQQGQTGTHALRDIITQGGDQLTFRGLPDAGGTRQTLRVTGDCLRALRDSGSGTRSCSLTGTLSDGRSDNPVRGR